MFGWLWSGPLLAVTVFELHIGLFFNVRAERQRSPRKISYFEAKNRSFWPIFTKIFDWFPCFLHEISRKNPGRIPVKNRCPVTGPGFSKIAVRSPGSRSDRDPGRLLAWSLLMECGWIVHLLRSVCRVVRVPSVPLCWAWSLLMERGWIVHLLKLVEWLGFG